MIYLNYDVLQFMPFGSNYTFYKKIVIDRTKELQPTTT